MLLSFLEAAFLVALAAGVYLLAGLGVALVVSGVLGVLACEWTSAQRSRRSRDAEVALAKGARR